METTSTTYLLSLGDITQVFAGATYYLAPRHQPRNFDVIINRLIDWFKSKIVPTGELYEVSDIDKFVDEMFDLLNTIPEFRQLNISNKDWEAGQREPGKCFVFVDRYSVIDPDYDFIDLVALKQNFRYDLKMNTSNSHDCFLCKYAKDYNSMEPSGCDECKFCKNNPAYKDNYITHLWAKLPVGSDEYMQLVKAGKIKR